MLELQGKTVLVCGATGALGGACADALGAAGATVVLAGKNIRALEKRYDALLAQGAPEPAIYPINFEGASGADFEAFGEQMQSSFGGLDGMIWAVGHWHGLEALNNLLPEQWFRSMHVNASAAWLSFQACFAGLRMRRGCAIFALQHPSQTQQAFAGAYGAAQAALRNWVLCAASENERLGPRVIGAELPPLKSKLRLAAFPAESVNNVLDTRLVAPELITLLASGAPGIHSIPARH